MMANGGDRVKSVLDDVKPLVLAQDFLRVCARLQVERDAAVAEGRFSDAASLSTMLGSFRSITGDEDAALRALESAEELDAKHPQRLVATAKYLFGRMGRKNAANGKLEEVLKDQRLDASTRHDALALRGRIALAEGRVGSAAEALTQAKDAATSANLEAMLWDRTLVRELADHSSATIAIRVYTKAWIERAENDVDDDTKEEGLKLLARLGGADHEDV
jgi:cytochrome c-type biogenesis protein CcmH/NrfG